MNTTATALQESDIPPGLLIPIFLDVEGVLRPAGSPLGLVCAKNLLAPLLSAEAMGLHPVLIISSTYRLDHDVHDLARILESHAHGIGRFVQGVTPVGSRMTLTDEQSARYAHAPRLLEVQAFLTRAKISHLDWIAIDDTPSLYGGRSPNCTTPPQLLVCDGRFGFDHLSAMELEDRLDVIARNHGLAVPSLPSVNPTPSSL